jgi:prophage antirepressor-like protein
MSKIVEFRSPAGALLRQVSESEQADLWFVAKDVCEALGLHVGSAMKRIPERHKGSSLMQTPGGPQRLGTVSEQGLYRLALRSRKPEAIAFSEWVTDEVLPEIRRTGSYRARPAPTDTALTQMAAAITVLAQGLTALQAQVTTLIEQRTVSLTLVQPRDVEELCRRLAFSALQAFRVGLFKSERSARTSFESRIRRACGWSRYRGARLEEMPITAWPYAKVEMSEIEADMKRAQDGRQLSLVKVS